MDAVETVLVSVPDSSQSRLEQVQPIWKTLETAVERENVYSLGVADFFSQPELEELYEWAKVCFRKTCHNNNNNNKNISK